VEAAWEGRQVLCPQLAPESPLEERGEGAEHKVLKEGRSVFARCSTVSVGEPLEGDQESAEQLEQERQDEELR